MQKARRQAGQTIALRPLVSIRFQVLFHSPYRGSFHLSLTLLFAIGHQVVFSLTGWSPWIHARFHGTGATREINTRCSAFAYGAVTLFGGTFQSPSTSFAFCNSFVARQNHVLLPQHPRHNDCRLTCLRFRLFPFRSPLLRESRFLSIPGVT